MLLWLWCRPTATAPISPLAWEPPCADGEALEKAKKEKKKKKNQGRGKLACFSKLVFNSIQQSHSWASIQRKP